MSANYPGRGAAGGVVPYQRNDDLFLFKLAKMNKKKQYNGQQEKAASSMKIIYNLCASKKSTGKN